MSATLSQKVQAVLAADTVGASALRDELSSLWLDAVLAQPVSALVDRAALLTLLEQALTADNAARIAERHVLPGLERIAGGVAARSDRLGDLLSKEAKDELTALVSRGEGPRFQWLDGAIDPEDLRQLIAPVTQQILFQFTTRLPIPGLGGGSGGGISGLVGRIGKQVQRSAGQLADVGRSLFGDPIRDFSNTATSEFRTALKERMETPEGAAIVKRIRERYLTHLLAVELDTVVTDLMRLPRPEVARLITLGIEHGRGHELVRTLVEGELAATLDALSERTLSELLDEAGLLASTRALITRALEPAVRQLVTSSAFAAWIEKLLARAEEASP